jgi:phosphatidylserine decarboxylase
MAGVRFDSAGAPFVGGALALALVVWWFAGWIFAAPLLVLGAFLLFFFRDPHRAIDATVDAVLSPADGRVMVAGPAAAAGAPPGQWLQIAIFLSPMDVHVNRIPVSGTITSIAYKPGRFLPAYRQDAGAVNEQSETWIDHNGRDVVVRQIVGVLARRVVNRLQVGAHVAAGDRYGVMKFGSRMDVFLPTDAQLRVRVGDIVRGGQTILAMLD